MRFCILHPNRLYFVSNSSVRSLIPVLHFSRTSLFCSSTPKSVSASTELHPRAKSVLEYWFGKDFDSFAPNYFPADKKKTWFAGGPTVDEEIRRLFGADVEDVARGRHQGWNSGFAGLAAVILLDQFTRNIHRGTADMFGNDAQAIELAKTLLEDPVTQRTLVPFYDLWLALPLMHSEKLEDQEYGMEVSEKVLKAVESMDANEQLLAYAQGSNRFQKAHRDVIKKYGRFPHRNSLLGRTSTQEEIEGLQNKTIPSFG